MESRLPRQPRDVKGKFAEHDIIKGLLIGLTISGMIETCQLVFCRGLFEWDDIIHNGFGCMVGCILSSGLQSEGS